MDPGIDIPVQEGVLRPPAGRSLSRDTVWFATGTIAGKAVALISLPIFARLLSPAEFGRLDVLNALISAGLAAFMLGTDVAVTRLYFDADSPRDRQRLLGSWVAFIAAVATPVAILLIIGASSISAALFGSADYTLAVSLVGVVMLVGLLHAAVLTTLRTLGRARAYGLLEGAALILNAVIAIGLLLVWRQDATAVMLALAISWGLATIIGLALVRPAISARPSTDAVSRLLALGLPLAPAVAAVLVGDFLNRSVLLGVGGADEAGFLSIGIRIASLAGLFVAATQLAWQPHAYRLGTSTATLAQLAREGRRIVVAIALVVVVLLAFLPEIVALIGGSRYAPAGPAAALALGATLGACLYVVSTLPIAMARATTQLAWSAIVGVAVAIVANLVLVQSYGSAGTAGAMLIGQVVAAAAAAAFARRHPRPPGLGAGVYAIVVATFALAIGSAVAWEPPLWSRMGLLALMVVLVWLEGTLPAAVRGLRDPPPTTR